MKILFTADTHVKLWSDREFDEDGIPKRLNEIFSVLESMCQHAIDNNIETIVIGGDINDTKGIVHVRAFVLLRNLIKKYTQIKFIFLHGNHDASDKDASESAINLLDELSNVEVILEHTIIDNMIFVPYSSHIVDDIVDSVDDAEDRILISHFGLSDATLSNGISLKTKISSKDLKKFKLVLLGHYHKPQNIGNVWYVGSPIPLKRDEHGESKRFLIVDTETFEVESIPTTGYRRYFEFVIEDEDAVESIFKEAAELKAQGHFVTIRNHIKELPTQLAEQMTVIDEYEEEYQMRGITTGMTIAAQMEKYLEIERIPEDEREEFMNVGIEVLG
ncbi:MAG: metallophosphoesterase family protein [Candidatus Peribacteraceae bacterium]|nr:metallophosphoesterase family protein [Candidatus Peribacteraceae bacterium]